MNCKAGDLAIVVSAPHPAAAHNIGRIVTVVKVINVGGLPSWVLKHPFKDGWLGTCTSIGDRDLRPIRGSESALLAGDAQSQWIDELIRLEKVEAL